MQLKGVSLLLIALGLIITVPILSSHKFSSVNVSSLKRHVHISSLSDSSRSIIVSFSSLPCDINDQALWVRDHNTTMFQQGKTRQGAILIGTNPLSLDTIIVAEGTSRYNATIKSPKKKHSRPFIYWSEYYHHVRVEHLSPNTTYYYQCILLDPSGSLMANRTNGHLKNISSHFKINATNYSMGENIEMEETVKQRLLEDSKTIHRFKTSPEPGINTRTKVAIIADVGVFQHSKDTLSDLGKQMDTFDAIFLLGDIAYANSDHRIWDDWFDMMDQQTFFRSKQLYIVAGNHDAEGDLETGDLFTAFENRFLMPQLAPAVIGRVSKPRDIDLNLMYQLPYDYGNSYYSFVHGSSYNIVLNSFADFEPGSRQYTWLVDELNRKVNRSVTPWVTIMIHCPLYNTFSFHQGDPQPINARRYLEPLFVQHRVNFVLSGHLHAYMRSKPVIDGAVDRRGPVHIIIGMSGRQANAPYMNADPEEWVAVRDHLW